MAGTSRDAQMESSASSDDSDSDTDTLLPFFGDGGEARSFTVSKTGWRRLVACIGIKLFKLKQKAACMVAGITPRALRKGNWLETWDDGGPAGVLVTANAGPTPKQMTPDTVKFLATTAKKRKMQSGEALRELANAAPTAAHTAAPAGPPTPNAPTPRSTRFGATRPR